MESVELDGSPEDSVTCELRLHRVWCVDYRRKPSGIRCGQAGQIAFNKEGLSAPEWFYHTHHIPAIPFYQPLLVTDFHFRVS